MFILQLICALVQWSMGFSWLLVIPKMKLEILILVIFGYDNSMFDHLTIPMDVSSDSWPRRPICCRFHPNHLPARAMLRASPKSKPSPPGFSFSASFQVPWRFLQLFVSLLGSRDREFIQRIEE